MKIKKSYLTPLLFSFLLILVVSFTFLYLRLQSVKESIFLYSGQSHGQEVSSRVSLADYFTQNSSFNILLLGYAGGKHDGTYLTDSMIVVHVDPKNSKVVMISIPRDIWVKIPTNLNEGSYWKINAAYQLGLDDRGFPKKQESFKGKTGGGNLAKNVVETITGLPIERFIALDFNGFTTSIDVLGGVDVQVETTFDDYEYPIDGKENDLCGIDSSKLPELEKIATISAYRAFPCRFLHLHFDSGVTHLDGLKALQFVRSRHSLQDGTDFGRSIRQRNLLSAFKQKIINVGFIPKLIPFVSSLKDDLSTDLTVDEIKELIKRSNDLSRYQVLNLTISDQNVLSEFRTPDGQSVLIPNDGIDMWEGVRNFLRTSLDPQRAMNAPVIKVENGTHISGLATIAVNRLKDRDFNVLPPVSADNLDQVASSIVVYNDKIDPKIIDDLKTEFNVSQVMTKLSFDPSFDIQVIVGKDYHTTYGKKLIN